MKGSAARVQTYVIYCCSRHHPFGPLKILYRNSVQRDGGKLHLYINKATTQKVTKVVGLRKRNIVAMQMAIQMKDICPPVINVMVCPPISVRMWLWSRLKVVQADSFFDYFEVILEVRFFSVSEKQSNMRKIAGICNNVVKKS